MELYFLLILTLVTITNASKDDNLYNVHGMVRSGINFGKHSYLFLIQFNLISFPTQLQAACLGRDICRTTYFNMVCCPTYDNTHKCCPNSELCCPKSVLCCGQDGCSFDLQRTIEALQDKHPLLSFFQGYLACLFLLVCFVG